MHEQNIICSKPLSDGNAYEQTIICRQLFAGHVAGSRPMKRKRKMHRMIILFVVTLRFSFAPPPFFASLSSIPEPVKIFTEKNQQYSKQPHVRTRFFFQVTLTRLIYMCCFLSETNVGYLGSLIGS